MSMFASNPHVRSGPRRGRARTVVAATITAVLAAAVVASPAAAGRVAPECPAAIIPNVAISPTAVGCWNAIAVQAVRLAAPYNL